MIDKDMVKCIERWAVVRRRRPSVYSGHVKCWLVESKMWRCNRTYSKQLRYSV